MLRHRAAVAILAGLATSVATAASLRVQVVPIEPDDAPAYVVLAVRNASGQRTERVAANTTVEIADAAEIEVLEPLAWWSPVVSTSDKAEIAIPLWRAAEVKGRVSVEKGLSLPGQLDATFDLKSDRVTITCPVDANGAWKCRLPETKLDIRLAAKDFAPHYVWDVALSRERATAIPPFALKRGGSIAGWVTGPEPEVELDRATVKLAPVSYGDSAELLSFTAKPNRRGFFQFTGVSAGRWVIVAESAGLSPSTLAEIEVDDRNESTVRDPLLLRDLADLAVSIRPEVYARGAPWRVRLNRRDPRSRYQQVVAESLASEAGEWTQSRVAAGEYDLEVVDARGAVYGTSRIAVGPDMAPVRITIDRIPVRGTVRVGDAGVAARLKFSSNRGETLSTSSNDEGEFRLQLPSEGKWRVDLRLRDTNQELTPPPVSVARKDGEPHAEVYIELPGGRIAGRVVDESGQPVKAGVILTRNGALLADILAENGTFELVGVAPGPAMIEAQAKGSHSGLLPVSIDVHASPVTLVLRRMAKLEGFVMTASGDPVAGASLRYVEPGGAFVYEVVTSPTGRFVIKLSADTTAISIAIAAPGLPSKLAMLRVPAGDEPVDVVMARTGGRLVVPIRDQPPPFPSLGREGAWASLRELVPPHFPGSGPPPWASRDGFTLDLEPGEYTLCATRDPSSGCVKQIVIPGATTIADTPRRASPEARGKP